MRISIGELAALSGVSIRTLHYYDQMDLLKPKEVARENGYRWYGEAEIKRLQEILFYRELDFPLREIRMLLTAPDYDSQKALERQRALLRLKRQRLDRILALLDDNLKGEQTMNFAAFDQQEIEKTRREYAAEAESRWGGTDAWKESQARTAGQTKEELARQTEEMNDIFRCFAVLKETDPAGQAAQNAVARWQAFITESYYPCTKEILAGLGQMYTLDERFQKNLDRFGAGTAAFMSAAIAVYCA